MYKKGGQIGSTFVECAILGGSFERSKKWETKLGWANQSSSFKTKQNKLWAHAPSPCQAESCEMIIVK
jgi:hypothetical protein